MSWQFDWQRGWVGAWGDTNVPVAPVGSAFTNGFDVGYY